ncbi:MAG: LysR family transcriptional regulator [Rhodoferax sp.]|uniref:LysR family transcriptional regulator n=1 Tax=Rhodoferax sp. TaxID=50421 RepID=UPI0026260951|nr:LysR family transcriptional regulator [Rhodoferax sp.]MDD5334996.1 LysR family transcriptional regulator [Rhodoferax sp.]
MEMRQLRIFCAVADQGSFTAAAETQHCVQSNVTMRVRELETELGQALFLRSRGGVALTAAGRTFLGYARRILQLADESRTVLSDSDTPRGLLRLGAMETTAAIRLPAVLMTYRQRHPEVQLSLVTGTTAELIRGVLERRLDAAFVGGFHPMPELQQEQVFEEELVLVSNSRFETLKALKRAMSGQSILVFKTGCFYRSTFERWLERAGLVPQQVLELGTLDGILSCVAAGMGVTLLPRTVIERRQDRRALRYHALPNDIARVATVLLRRQDTPETAALRCMVEIARDQRLVPAPATS